MGKDASEIRSEIAATRERMAGELDAIAYKADVPSRMNDAVTDKVQAVNERVQNVKDTVTNAASRVTSAITGSVGSVGNRVGDAMPSTQDIRDAGGRAYDFVRENPLGVFFALAAVGFLIGSLLPSTDIEQQRLGPVADRIKETAKNTVTTAVSEGRAALQETIAQAQSTATETFTEHAKNVANAAQDSMRTT